MKLFWMVLAGVAILIAAILLWFREFSAAFVVAAIGLVAWFLNYRIQMRDLVIAADLENEKKREAENLDEV